MSKQNKIRLILYTAFVIIALAIGLIVSSVREKNLSLQLNAANLRALTELEDYVSAINTDLEKSIYVNTPTMLATMSDELSRDACAAKDCLAALPLGDAHLENTCKFLSQVGSFVASLNLKVALGETINDEERAQLESLINISSSLSDELTAMLEDIESGYLSFSASESTLAESDAKLAGLNAVMSDAEQAITDYPTLLYDGPFSDKILTSNAKMLDGKEEISQESARIIASVFLGVGTDRVVCSGETDGKIPSFVFTEESATLAVSKKGGYVIYLLGSSNAGESLINPEQAISNASDFLVSQGYTDMKENYYSVQDGICTINFAYQDNGVICYSDLIKVSVSLESGKILSFDSRGYIMNHTTRSSDKVKLSLEQARQSVSPALEIISSVLCVIPTDYGGETTAYEFHCKDKNGTEVLVYINADTGEESNILILLYSDGGVLTK